MASSDKKIKGKQKIEIKIIENVDDRLIVFCKRRTGIYKKISELSTLCGGEILFIIFSPTRKPYSFGHPSVESVAKRFSDASKHFEETTGAPIETYQFNNLISITRDKKIAAISSLQAPMDDDVPSSFPLRYGPNLQ
ncbi:hypothetical protein Gotur_032331 [Gossypium turneri]